MNFVRTMRASATCRLRAALLSGASAAALALALLPGMAAPAHAEPSVQEVLETLGPIAGADGVVTEVELRGWIGYLIASDPDPNATPPTPAQIDQFINTIPSTTDGSGTRVFSLETIVLATAHEQLPQNGGVWDGNSEPTLTQAAVIAQQAAGADGILTEAEFRAWADSLTGSFQVSDADIDDIVGRINAAGGTFSIVSLLAELSSDRGDNGNGGGGVVVDNGGGTGGTGGSDNGSGGPSLAEIQHQLSVIAGDDHILTVQEFRDWAATLPNQPTSAELDQFLATLPGAGDGTFTVDEAVAHLAATDGGGNQGGGEVVDNGGGTDNANTGGGGAQQPGWNCDFSGNRADCLNSITGQVSVSAIGPGAAIVANNDTDISTSGDGQGGIVLQLWPYYDPDTGRSTQVYDHPDMTLVNTGDITTTGFGSAAINAWGGSGAIRIENSGDLTASGANGGGINVHAGMFDLGVRGGDIAIINSGNILAGPNSAGINAQSGSWGDGGDITIANTGNIQSGGWAAISARTAGGDISVTNSGALSGAGQWAAIGVRTEGGSAIVNNTGNISVTDAGAGGISVDAEEGPVEAGQPHPHQSADINNSGNINLLGEEQNALEAYAFNGQATVVNSGQISSSQYWATGISVDAGNEDSNASAATVLHSGSIALTGASSMGIQASTPLGTVNVQNSGTVRATGENSIGIFTVGAFGGSALVNNDGGTVVGGTGSTTFGTTGQNNGGGTAFTGSAGILMLGSDINTIYNTGTITSANGQAIATFEGALTIFEWDDEQQEDVEFTLDIPVADTTIYNRAAGLIDGDIRLGSGDDRIFNAGRITGDIDMAGGTNLLENAAGGILTGSSIIVGAGNTFSNAGTLSPGGTGVIAETIVVGNFVQSSSGRMVIDINETAGVRSDSINVSGTAALAGTVTPNVIDLGQVVEAEYRILTAAGGVTDNGIVANPNQVQVSDTVGYDFALEQRGANELYLTAQSQKSASEIAADAADASGATGQTAQNFAALGDTLDALEDAGDDKTLPVLNAIRLQDGPANAAKVMDRLIPQQQGEQAGGAARSGASFGNAMLSCASRDGEYAYTREGKCYYAKLTVRRLDHDASASGSGVKETSSEAMGGIQFGIGGERRLGLAFGYEDINSKAFSLTQGLGSSEGQRFQGGIVLKDQWGPINAYLNIAGSYGEHDNKRFVNLGGFTNALAEQEVMSGLIKLRLSYLRDMGGWYVKPLVDVGASYIHLGGYTETGAGAFNLRVATTEKWLFSVMPGLELGGEIRDGGGTIWRPYIRAGVTLFNDDGLNVSAGFADAPAGVGGFNVATQLDTIYADVDAGMHVLTTSGLNLRFNYEGRYGESTRMHAGTVKFSLPY